MKNHYAKLFLQVSITSGIVVAGIILIILFPNIKPTIAALVLGGLMGLVFTIVVVSQNSKPSSLVSRRSNKKPRYRGVHHKSIIELNQCADDVYMACLRCLESDFQSKSISQNQKFRIINATTAMTWKSFGEIVNIKIVDKDGYASIINVSSSPIVSWLPTDCGQNRINVEKVVRWFELSDIIK